MVDTSETPTQRARSLTDLVLDHWRSAALLIVAAGSFLVVLALHGLLPGQSQPTIHHHFGTGAIECLRTGGWQSLRGTCERVGLPVGQPFITGGALYVAGVPFAVLPFIDSSTANTIVQILTDLGGFVGGYLLARRLGAYRLPAIMAGFGYVASLTVVYMNGYISTFNGFVLLPLHAFLAVAAMTSIDTRHHQARWIVALLASTAGLAFIEGYAWVAGAMLTGVFWLFWAANRDLPPLIRRRGIATYVGTVAISAMAYTFYVPGDAYRPRESIDFFRSMGVDVATLVVPQRTLWWARSTGVHADFSAGWGDASAYRANYLGFFLLALAVVALARKGWRSPAGPLAVAGFAALLLSLGPSLKVYDLSTRDLAEQPTAYLMPADQATTGLPTTLMYEHLPGFNSMRATFRWIAVTVLCLFQLGALALTRLWRADRRPLALGLGVLALVEVFPDAPTIYKSLQGQRDQIVQWEDEGGPVVELDELLRPEERVLFLPASNDFLANELAVRSDTYTYNVGGDKNYFYARDNWPESIQIAIATFGAENGPAAAAVAMQADADAIVFPFFNLRDNALIWPPSPEQVAEFRERAASYADETLFDVEIGDWYMVIRPAGAS